LNQSAYQEQSSIKLAPADLFEKIEEVNVAKVDSD